MPNRPASCQGVFLSTLSLRRATEGACYNKGGLTFLSTLSLRRATSLKPFRALPLTNFYPRSPCGERRFASAMPSSMLLFLSTLSLRRATPQWLRSRRSQRDFYPRSPCGERLPPMVRIHFFPAISIHALLAESDGMRARVAQVDVISIHALLAESDFFISRLGILHGDFYPRSPCGERHARCWARQHPSRFLSTLSLRRATL